MEAIWVIIGLISFFFFMILMVFAYILYKKQEIEAEKAYNNYRIQKRKLNKASKDSRNANEDEDDEVEEFIESLPPWLSSIAEGANIDLVKVYAGEPSELQKVKDILNKNLGNSTEAGAGGASLV